MIFYFTGTGNSQAAATQLLSEGEQLISMAECLKEKKYSFEVDEKENVGFVFPVYYGGLPSIVQAFLNHLELTGTPHYTYGVITCGAKIYGAGKMLAGRLAEKSIILNAVYPVKMPDNYIVMYAIQEEEEAQQILAEAEEELEEIKKKITFCTATEMVESRRDEAMTAAMYPLYARGRKTKKFWTDDRCVSCGVCEKRCPSGAIRLIDGKVTWVKEQCAHCMACARCNAIQYGKATMDRKRYTHPMLRKKKAAESSCH